MAIINLIKNFKRFILILCVCVTVYVTCTGVCSHQKEASDSQKLQLYMAVSCLMLVLGTELWFSGRTRSSLNHWVSSPTPTNYYFRPRPTYNSLYLFCTVQLKSLHKTDPSRNAVKWGRTTDNRVWTCLATQCTRAILKQSKSRTRRRVRHKASQKN